MFTGFLNNRAHQVYTMVLKAQDESDIDDQNYTTYPIATFNLVANQQDYAFSASDKVMQIKRVEITYDGTNWYKAEPFDINQRGLASATNALGDFSSTKPFYDYQANSIFFYPIPSTSVTAGAKVWYARELDEFTTSDTTQEPGFIDEPFHRMLSIGASLDWAIAKGQRNVEQLKREYAEYEQRLINYYGGKQKDRQYQLTPAFIDYN